MRQFEDFDLQLCESNIPFWARPYEFFLEFVDVDGTKVRRFEKPNE